MANPSSARYIMTPILRLAEFVSSSSESVADGGPDNGIFPRYGDAVGEK